LIKGTCRYNNKCIKKNGYNCMWTWSSNSDLFTHKKVKYGSIPRTESRGRGSYRGEQLVGVLDVGVGLSDGLAGRRLRPLSLLQGLLDQHRRVPHVRRLFAAARRTREPHTTNDYGKR